MSAEKRDHPIDIKWIEVTPERAKGFLGSFKVTEEETDAEYVWWA